MLNRKKLRYVPAILALGIGVLGGASALFAAPDAAKPGTPTLADNSPFVIGPDGRVTKKVEAPIPDSPAFASFREWLRKYNASSPEQKKRVETEGVELAKARRQAMAELIPLNPARALELSVKFPERKGLPAGVVQQLEEILQGRADYGLLHSLKVESIPVPGKPGETKHIAHSHYQRIFTFKGRSYTPYLYGKRAGLLSKVNLPFYGIAVDKVLAIQESPIWVLAPGQTPPAGATPSKSGTKSPVTGKEAKDGLVGIVGSTIYYFESQADLTKFTEDLWAAESVIGPSEHG